jgi:hypothetical protein
MKKPRAKRDAKAKQPRELDVATLDTVQGGASKRPDEEEQHNETFVRARAARRRARSW